MRRLISFVLFCITLVSCHISTPCTDEYLALIHGTLVDGTGSPEIRDGTIVVKNNRIMDLGPFEQVPIPEHARVINVKGMTVLPGIIDSHVHGSAPAEVRRAFLRAGVTTVCDLGSPLREMPDFENLRGQEMARVVNAGPIITTPHGLPDTVMGTELNYEVGTPEQAAQAVDDLACRGADLIKIYLEPADGIPMLSREQVEAIVQRAHSKKMLVRAHLSKRDALPMAIEAGIDVVEHASKPRFTREELEKQVSASSDPIQLVRDLLESEAFKKTSSEMINKGVVWVPTFARGMGRFYEDENATPGLRYLAEGLMERVFDFHRAGGAVALGSDYFPAMPGKAGEIHLSEIRLLAAAGLEPIDVIVACTRNAARACGMEDRIGTLEEGKLADMLVVNGDPIADLPCLREVALVLKDGKIAYRVEKTE